jgi:hypothetical protein
MTAHSAPPFPIHWLYVVWAAIGPLVGVIIGAWLTSRWQRKQWVLDNKAREYREALDALNTYRRALLSHLATQAGAVQAMNAGQTVMALAQSQVHLDSVLADRIFTLDAVANSGVRDELMRFYQSQISANPPSITLTTQSIADMHLKLLETAVADLRLKKKSQ